MTYSEHYLILSGRLVLNYTLMGLVTVTSNFGICLVDENPSSMLKITLKLARFQSHEINVSRIKGNFCHHTNTFTSPSFARAILKDMTILLSGQNWKSLPIRHEVVCLHVTLTTENQKEPWHK